MAFNWPNPLTIFHCSLFHCIYSNFVKCKTGALSELAPHFPNFLCCPCVGEGQDEKKNCPPPYPQLTWCNHLQSPGGWASPEFVTTYSSFSFFVFLLSVTIV